MRRARLYISLAGGALAGLGIFAACAQPVSPIDDVDASTTPDSATPPKNDSGTGGDAAKSDAGCATGETKCGPACKNLTNDPQNCGQCGTACGAGKVCEQSECHLGCSNQTRCVVPVGDASVEGGVETCVDTKTNVAHCGGCNAACAGGLFCDAGACDLDCTDAGTKCAVQDAGLACIDTKTNNAHCGACNAPCTGGKVCIGGSCQVAIATNIAPLGTVTISGGGSTGNYLPSQANNGISQATNCNMFAWINGSSAPGTDWMQVDWGSTSHVVQSVTVDTNTTGVDSCGNSGRLLAGAQVQWWNGSTWVTATTISGQVNDWTYTFGAPVTTTKIRLYGVYAAGGQASNPVVFELTVNGT